MPVDQALKAREKRRPLGAEVEQHFLVDRLRTEAVHDHGRDRRQRILRETVRREPDRRRRPQHAAETLRPIGVSATTKRSPGSAQEEPALGWVAR